MTLCAEECQRLNSSNLSFGLVFAVSTMPQLDNNYKYLLKQGLAPFCKMIADTSIRDEECLTDRKSGIG